MCPSPAVSSSPSSSLQYREVAELLSIVNICSSMDMTNSPTPAANQAPPHALSTAITAACSCPHHVSVLQPSSQHVSLAASCILVIILAAGSQNPGPGYSYLRLVWRHELCLGYEPLIRLPQCHTIVCSLSVTLYSVTSNSVAHL